jgi:hypothetical protein
VCWVYAVKVPVGEKQGRSHVIWHANRRCEESPQIIPNFGTGLGTDKRRYCCCSLSTIKVQGIVFSVSRDARLCFALQTRCSLSPTCLGVYSRNWDGLASPAAVSRSHSITAHL